MNTTPGSRAMWGTAWMLAATLLLQACAAPGPSPAAATPVLPTATATPDASPEAILARVTQAVALLDEASSLHWTYDEQMRQAQTFNVDGLITDDYSRNSVHREESTAYQAGDHWNTSATRDYTIDYVDHTDGTESHFEGEGGLRSVDGREFVRGSVTQPTDESVVMPDGWVELRNELSLFYWYGLLGLNMDRAAAQYAQSPSQMVTGAPPEQLASILKNTLVSASTSPGTLDDGTPVEVVQLALNKQALLALGGLDLNVPGSEEMLQRQAESPIHLTVYLDSEGHLRGYDEVMDVAGEAPFDAITDIPDQSHVTTQQHLEGTLRMEQNVEAPAIQPPELTTDFPSLENPGDAGGSAFATLDDLDRRIAEVANGGDADAFWRDVEAVGHIPLIYGSSAIFLYRGDGTSVSWEGDWTAVRPNTTMRLGESNIWAHVADLPRDARVEYLINVDGQQVLDPLNPLTETGGLGSKSVVMMPDYQPSPYAEPREGVPTGTLTEDIRIESEILGYGVNYRVYTPAGYEAMRDLPVAYITDGQDFLAFAHAPTVLDNLIAEGRISPVIAVLIDPRDVNTGQNLRETEFLKHADQYSAFIVEELVPHIDATYRTRPSADARAIIGASYGGSFSAYVAQHHSATFGLIGMFSPAFWQDLSVATVYEETDTLPVRMFITTGTMNDQLWAVRPFYHVLEAKGYDVRYVEVNEGHSYGQWRGLLDDMLIYFWGA